MFSMGELEYLCSKSWILDTPEVFSYPDPPRPNGCEVPSVTRLTLQRKYWFNFPFDSSSFSKIFETRLNNYHGSFAAMIKWRNSRQDTEYKPGLNSRRERNAHRSYIGHAQRINFGRPRPKFQTKTPKRDNCFHAKYGKGKLETFRTYTFIDHRFPVALLLCFELSLSKTLYGFQTPRLTRLSSYLYGNWGQLRFESLNAPFE